MGKKNWNPKELSNFKEIILKKRNILHDEITDSKTKADEILKTSTANALYSSHMADASADHVEMEKAYYFVQRESNFLKYLNRAIDMIERGTFGICSGCQELISKERLMEVPHTRSCFTCKSKR